MNVDAQFPQPLAPEPLQRPIAKPVEQAIERPVDNSKSAEAANNKSEKDSARARSDGQNTRGDEAAQTPRSDNQLSEEDKAKLDNLRARDREVRAHEAAHKSAAGGYAKGSAQFTFDEGPDGKRYAVGGEVSIDTSKVSGDPQATINKARTIRAAANAPAQPSGQDRSVAAQATQMETEARQEVAEEQRTDTSSASSESGNATVSNFQGNQEVAGPQQPDASGTNNQPDRTPVSNFQANSADPEPVGELLEVLA